MGFGSGALGSGAAIRLETLASDRVRLCAAGFAGSTNAQSAPIRERCGVWFAAGVEDLGAPRMAGARAPYPMAVRAVIGSSQKTRSKFGIRRESWNEVA